MTLVKKKDTRTETSRTSSENWKGIDELTITGLGRTVVETKEE
jgi:hypothetical protein